ncbi:MAG TPA: UDP-3-O-acyl-N-acetylglucosamine deacetylase, partial [Pseudobdellovibrionaceae bacterium]|nr:UDP-3-O-acyl-N-acetylglucosamine deacetylase [Pseudobdellovibrionaceae bacterium]
LGGSMENVVVLGEHEVLNPEGLRWSDEFVRHKVLDALGDLVTLEMPLMGHVVLHKAGHDVMNKLVKLILDSPHAYRQAELGEVAQSNESQEKSVWMVDQIIQRLRVEPE